MAYRGVVAKLPVGSQGFTGTLNPSQAGPGHFLFVDGAELDSGIIRKEGGAAKLNASALGAGAVIVSGTNWSPTPGTNYDVVFLSDGSVLRDSGGGTFPTTYVAGLTNVRDPPPWFVAAGGETVGSPRALFLYSSINQVHVALGTSPVMNPIALPAADWAASFPTFGVQHGTRMWAGGNSSDPHRIYYSSTADHGDFSGPTAGTLAIYPGEGERLAGALSFRGALVLFKYPKGIYIVNTTDPAPVNWSVARLTRSVGTLNQHTIVQVENDVIYMDRFGDIHRLSATDEFGDVNTSNIGSREVLSPFMKENINLSLLRRTVGIWYAARRQAWFAMPRVGSVDNDFRLIVGFGEPDEQGTVNHRFFMSRRDIPVSLWLRPDGLTGIEKPAMGDEVGFVWEMDTESRNKDGVAYPIIFETSNNDLSFLDQQLSTRAKTGQFLELGFEPKGEWFLTVEVYWDDILTEIVQFSMGNTAGAVLDSFTLDTNVLASSVVKSERKRITGSGRRIRLVAENDGLNQDVSLSEFHLSFILEDERITE